MKQYNNEVMVSTQNRNQLTEFKKQKNNMKDKLNKKRSNLRWSKSHSNTVLLIFLYECPTIKQTFSKECQRLGT